MKSGLAILVILLPSLAATVDAQNAAGIPDDVKLEKDVVYATADGFNLLLDIA